MNALRQRAAGLASLLGLVAASLFVSVNVGAQAEMQAQAAPFTGWEIQDATELDGTGSVFASENVPAPAEGQATENRWTFAQVFRFVGNADAFGVVSLDTDGGDRFATLALSDGSAPVRFPFDWQADRLYLPYVYLVPGDVLVAFVYDFTADEYTFVGFVRVPADWGRLAPETSTLLRWYGDAQPSCEAYPVTDHYRMAPFGLVGGDPVVRGSLAIGDGEVAGTCPAETTTEPNSDWRRYRAGSATGPTTTTTEGTTTTSEETTTTTEPSTTTTTEPSTTTTTEPTTTTTTAGL